MLRLLETPVVPKTSRAFSAASAARPAAVRFAFSITKFLLMLVAVIVLSALLPVLAIWEWIGNWR